MKIIVITIGDELMIGQVVDTNSAFLASRCRAAGFELLEIVSIHDDGRQIVGAVKEAMSRADVVVTTGGLGPTKDDITKEALMQVFGGELVADDDVLDNVKTIVARRGIELNSLTARQCMVPSTCRVLRNDFGTAPVMWFEKDAKVLVALPGVPFEMKGCWESVVIPALAERFGSDGPFFSRTFIVSGITESDMALRLAHFEDALGENMHLAYLPQFGILRLRLDARGCGNDDTAHLFDNACGELRALITPYLLADDDLTPAQILLRELEKRGLRVATAESCTGGNIAAAITAVAGASRCFNGSVVAYSNEVKHRVLGVLADTLEAHGAVSLPVVEEMARGVAALCQADCAIATSGIAGPGGGTPQKPVGTVCMAVKAGCRTISKTWHFTGNRSQIVQRAVAAAIVMLIQLLQQEDDK